MRVSERNKQTVWYSNYSSRTELKDECENATGEYKIAYSAPAKAAWNVSVVESDADVAMFGVQAIDTIVGVADRAGFPLDETSILWYGITPTIKEDGTTNTPYNYRIVGTRPSLNVVRFYAQKVDVAVPVKTEPETTMPEPPVEGDGE